MFITQLIFISLEFLYVISTSFMGALGIIPKEYALVTTFTPVQIVLIIFYLCKTSLSFYAATTIKIQDLHLSLYLQVLSFILVPLTFNTFINQNKFKVILLLIVNVSFTTLYLTYKSVIFNYFIISEVIWTILLSLYILYYK